MVAAANSSASVVLRRLRLRELREQRELRGLREPRAPAAPSVTTPIGELGLRDFPAPRVLALRLTSPIRELEQKQFSTVRERERPRELVLRDFISPSAHF